MGYEVKIMDLLERNEIQGCYWDNEVLIVPVDVGANKIFDLIDEDGHFYCYPAVLELASA